MARSFSLPISFAFSLATFVAPAQGDVEPASVRNVAAELGLSAESLAVAGVTEPATVLQILSTLSDAADLRQSLVIAHAAADDAAQAVTLATRSVLTASQDSGAQMALLNAQSSLEAARTQVATIRQELREDALDGLPAGCVEALAVWRDSSAHEVPPEFCVRLRTKAEWQAIEAALRMEARAQRLGQAVPTQHAQVLGLVRGDSEVMAAAGRLATHRDLIANLIAGFGDN